MRVTIGDDWDWPWFRECRSEFLSMGIWPAYWYKSAILPSMIWLNIPAIKRPRIFLSTLMTACYSARWRGEMQNRRRLGIDSFMTLALNKQECPVEAYFLALHRDRFIARDDSMLPPYYPLDRLSARISTDGAAAQHRSEGRAIYP